MTADGSRTQDVAGSKLAFQSSAGPSSVASAAVDGDNATCTITERESEPFWTVELGAIYTVSAVHINAGNIHVTNSLTVVVIILNRLSCVSTGNPNWRLWAGGQWTQLREEFRFGIIFQKVIFPGYVSGHCPVDVCGKFLVAGTSPTSLRWKWCDLECTWQYRSDDTVFWKSHGWDHLFVHLNAVKLGLCWGSQKAVVGCVAEKLQLIPLAR